MCMLCDHVAFGLLTDSLMIVMLLSLICSVFCQMYLSGLITGFDVKSKSNLIYLYLGSNLDGLNHYFRSNFLFQIWQI